MASAWMRAINVCVSVMNDICSKLHGTSSTILHYRLPPDLVHDRPMDVRGRLRKIIDEKGLNPNKVSLAAGLSSSMVHKFLTEQTKSITVDNLEKVAEACGVSLRYLLYGDEEQSNVVYWYDKLNERDQRRVLRLMEDFADEADAG